MSASDKHNILRNILGRDYQSGNERLFYCPKCNHHKAKMSINIDKDVFKCWVCDYVGTSIYRLVRKYGTHNQRKQWKKYDGVVELDRFEQIAQSLFDTEKLTVEETISLPNEFISLVNKNLSRSATQAKNYLLKRGLTQEDITYWKIGYCPDGEYKNRIVVPSFSLTGQVNYYVARTYVDDWKKYMNPNVSKNNMIFNHLYLDFDNDLVVTEGIFDAVIAGRNSVPVLGSTLKEGSTLFKEVVNNDTPVYIAMDQDAEKKALTLVNKLLKYGIEVHKIDISPYKDVAEMTRNKFLERKKAATLLTTEGYISYKLEHML